MTIYQVINKHNQLAFAFLSYEVAVEEVALLNATNKKDRFTINVVKDVSI
jgi:predicted nucleic-acid-binding protein